jgi:hypothetical protein
MIECISKSSRTIWAAGAGLLVGRYLLPSHPAVVIGGISARLLVPFLVAGLIVLSTWYSASDSPHPWRVVQASALPVSLWAFSWYGFALIPDLSYVAPHDVLLISLAFLSALPVIAQFSICLLEEHRKQFPYWIVLYLSALLLLLIYPLWSGAFPSFWQTGIALLLLSLGVPASMGAVGRPSWTLAMAIFVVSTETAGLVRVSGVESILLGGSITLLSFLIPTWYLQATHGNTRRARPARKLHRFPQELF